MLLIDKPKWRTSFDVVKKLKQSYPRKTKIGHSWTLDPMATGLLLIAVWPDTKKLQALTALDKTYVATIDFSRKTDTRDMDHRRRHTQGKVMWDNIIFDPANIVDTRPDLSGVASDYGFVTALNIVQAPSKDALCTYIDTLVGIHDIDLTPFSAKKVDGKKLYEYAREWNPIFKKTPMNVISYELLEYSFPVVKIKFHVGSGTYIRSLAHVIGAYFWLGGILTQLRRTAIGEWKVDDAQSVEEIWTL